MTEAEIGRFRRIETLFDQALDRPAGPLREAWLREACHADAELYEAVASFLLEHEALSAAGPPPEPMPRFGAWQAVRLLGRGGMGTVYLAERADGAFRMGAAVKVVPLALASPEIEERFRRERQFLAGFDHPGIARLIDGGLSQHGIPYLVMEFVDGLPIDRYCRERNATNHECAALFRQLLEALAYIHGRQVVHRDLKPTNVLVDAAGKVRLLDFGAARLADAGGGDAITKSGVFALTPEFASPEQLGGGIATFASDIYSAGLVLRSMSAGTDPRLEAVIGRALRAKPEDRYGSAGEMDRDLDRYLAGLKVRPSPRALRSRWALATCLAVCLAIGLGVYARFPSRPEAPSLAVLPFKGFADDMPGRYVADSFGDEIAASLSRLKPLRVVARSSTLPFEGKPVDVREAGRLLKVGNILEGSVARSGDRVRIEARLERTSDGTVLWSNAWERDAADLFAVQAELAAGIAGSLKIAGSAVARHVPKPEAHELVMRARYEAQQVTPESMTRAEQAYRRAIELDPDYAEAWVGLASASYGRAAARGSVGQSDAERGAARQMARHALSLDPDLPAARAILATLAMQYDWDWAGAERELRLAGEGSPNASVENQYIYLLLFRGRFAEADRHIQRLLDLDPFSTTTMFNLSQYRILERRYADARETAQRIAAQYPAMIPPQQTIARTWIQEGRPELALQIYRQLEPRFPEVRMQEAMAYAAAGRRDEALRLTRPFEAKYPDPGVPAQWFALVYAPLGDDESALKWLERSADRHEFQILSIGVSPVFEKMRESPRFRALRKRIGLDE
jgi:serine/threonine protein kinase